MSDILNNFKFPEANGKIMKNINNTVIIVGRRLHLIRVCDGVMYRKFASSCIRITMMHDLKVDNGLGIFSDYTFLEPSLSIRILNVLSIILRHIVVTMIDKKKRKKK